MKLIVLTEHLQKKISFVGRAVSQRSQLPILLNYLIQAKKGKLYISGTDLELGIQVSLPCSVTEEGETTVPARTFSDLMSSLPSGKATIQTREDSLEITTEKTKSSLQTIKSEDFPKLYEEKGGELVRTQRQNLDKYLPRVVFAASNDIGRPALSGILFKRELQQKNERFLLVATDGYRLSLQYLTEQLKLEGEKREEEKPVLIPAGPLRELLAVKEGGDGVSIFISRKNNQVIFEQEDVIIVGRLIGLEFPEYEKIIPQDYLTQSVFDKDELQQAVKICSVFARDSANVVKFKVEKQKIIVSSSSSSLGTNEVEVEAKTVGEENEIAFNARYLLELLSNIEEEQLVFEMTNPLKPGVFKIKDDPTFLHLIMPIRIQTEQ